MLEHNDFSSKLKEEMEDLQKLQKNLKASISKMPQGTLHTKKIRRVSKVKKQENIKTEYYWYQDRKNRKYINKKNRNLAAQLAQKEHYQEILKNVENRLDFGMKLLQQYETTFEQIYENTSEEKKILTTPLELSDNEYIEKWYKNNPGGQNKYPFSTPYYTEKDEIVRSKSEKILADLLTKHGVPYVYEPLLILGSGNMVYPDFLLLNVRLRKTIIYEHFGVMGDGGYSERVCEKISLYQKNNYMLGDHFIFTMESENHPLDTKMFEKMIIEYVK